VSCQGSVCGSDVTKQVKDAVAKTRGTFAGWTNDGKKSACSALTDWWKGAVAWDIIDLHENGWILNYRPDCATVGADPPCGSSIQVGDQCYYAGSVNYVIFGVMCRLCSDFYGAVNDASSQARYSENAMLWLIWNYKVGLHPLDPSPNYQTAKEWSSAGYNGWPQSAKAPPGDASNCKPACPTPFRPTGYDRKEIRDRATERREPPGRFDQRDDFIVHWMGSPDEVF
jgi:hypothetical protein